MKRLPRILRFLLPAAGAAFVVASFARAVSEGYFDPASIALGGAGFALFLTMFVRDQLPRLPHYANALLYSGFVFGTLVCGYILVERHAPRLDLTATRRHTLSDGTRRALELLRKDVEIVAFDVEDRPYRELLDLYAGASSRVSWRAVDPRKDPLLARRFDAAVAHKTIYIRSGEKTKRISLAELNEGQVTNAIAETTRDREISVYFLQGHGELSIEPKGDDQPPDPRSAMALREFLAGRAIRTGALDLARRGFVPQDADALILAGPERDLEPLEARQIAAWIAAGGRALILFDAPRETGKGIDYPNLVGLLRAFGLDDDESVVVDLNGQRRHDHPLKAPVESFNPRHPVTEALARARGPEMAMSLVRAIRAGTPPEGWTAEPLISSSADAWAEPFVNLGRKVSPPSELAARPLGWAVSSPAETGGRLVVYGSSEPARDDFLLANDTAARLTLGSIEWLTERGDRVFVPERVVPGTPMIPSAGELRMVQIWVAIVFPSILLFGGVAYTRLARGN